MTDKYSSAELNQLLDAARDLHQNGQTPEAIELLETNSTYSDSSRLLALTSHFYYVIEQYPTAALTARKALETDSNNRLALQTLGEIDMKAGHYDEAATWFHEAIASGARTSHPYIRLAASLNMRHKFTEASDVLQKGLEKFPDDLKLMDQLQYSLTMDGRTAEAAYIHDIRKRRESEDTPDIAGLLNRFEALGTARAISQLKILANMNHYKNETLLHDRLAHLMIEEEQFDKAIPHLEIVLKQQPRNIQIKLKLALCLFLSGSSERAWKLLNAMQSRHEDAYYNYVKTEGLIVDGQYQEALRLVITQLERSPRDKRFRKLLKRLKNKGARLSD